MFKMFKGVKIGFLLIKSKSEKKEYLIFVNLGKKFACFLSNWKKNRQVFWQFGKKIGYLRCENK